MRVFKALNVILLLSWAAVPTAQAGNDEQMPAQYATCSACHGDAGQGRDSLNAPALAGQFDWYLERQLNHFRSALRGNHPDDTSGQQMAAISKQIADSDIAALSQFLAAMPAPTNASSAQGDLMNGSRYYQAKCGACHGGQAQGNPAFNAPRLNTLSASYLSRQMDHFVSGVRGTGQQDKYGRQMAMMAKMISAAELKDVIFYITQSGQAEGANE